LYTWITVIINLETPFTLVIPYKWGKDPLSISPYQPI